MDKKFCKFCGEEIEKDAMVCPKCGRQLKVVKKEEASSSEKSSETKYDESSKFYTKAWFMWAMLIFFAPVGIFLMWKFHPEMKKNTKIILTIVFAILFLAIAFGGNSDETTTNNDSSNSNSNSNTVSKVKVEVIDFSGMSESEILTWCKEKNLNCSFKREYSDTVSKDGYIKQSVNATEQVTEGSKITVTYSLGKEPTTEQKNALRKAESYAKTMHMSKQGIYDQLTSEYGEGFDKEAAQYAIDNIEWDWNANALAKAKSYRDTMSMSKNRIYDQLVSQYGEKFTKEEAQYAIDHLDD
jgi:hypothetical protein